MVQRTSEAFAALDGLLGVRWPTHAQQRDRPSDVGHRREMKALDRRVDELEHLVGVGECRIVVPETGHDHGQVAIALDDR